MSHTPVLSASNTLPAASNGTNSTCRPARRASSLARSTVTPRYSPPAPFCTRTPLPRLSAARSLPVGARSFTTSGGTVLIVPLWLEVWANDVTVAASRRTAAPRDRYMSCSTDGMQASVRNSHLTVGESDQGTGRRCVRDGRHVGRHDGRSAGTARDGVHHLARRQRASVAQVIVHDVHRLDEVAMQRDVFVIVTSELIEAVEVMRVGDLVITQRRSRAVHHVVEPEIGARREVRRQDAVVAPGHEHGGNATELARREDVLDAVGDAVRLLLRRAGQPRAGGGIAAGGKRTQAQRAVEVLIGRRAAILLRPARGG